jgi:hypothetical protein
VVGYTKKGLGRGKKRSRERKRAGWGVKFSTYSCLITFLTYCTKSLYPEKILKPKIFQHFF